jgi:hypothetical protein
MGGGLVCEAGAMERGHQEIARAARAISGEDATRAIGAVGRRREADDQHAGERIAESRNRSSPVRVAEVRTTFFACDTLTVRPKAWASLARHDVGVD